MEICEQCQGQGVYYQMAFNPAIDGPSEARMNCMECEDGLIFDSDEERRLYEVLMT